MSTATAGAQNGAAKKPYSDFNQVIVKGRLTRNPDVKYLPSGTCVVSGSIASHRGYESKGEVKEETHFFDFSWFGQKAQEWANSNPAKGMRVKIEGRLNQRRWETPEGEKRAKVDIYAFSVGDPNEQQAQAPDAGLPDGSADDQGSMDYQEQM